MSKNVHRPQNHFLDLESEKYGNQVPHFENFEKTWKTNAHGNSVQNGCDTFPNELMRFRFEAKPIWENIQNIVTNAVIF